VRSFNGQSGQAGQLRQQVQVRCGGCHGLLRKDRKYPQHLPGAVKKRLRPAGRLSVLWRRVAAAGLTSVLGPQALDQLA
jgi:hypothetical protein